MIDFNKYIEILATNNNISTSFYFPDNISFAGQGISDKYNAYFYLRHIDFKNKYQFRKLDENADLVSSRMRIVFSLQPAFCQDDVLYNLVNMIKAFSTFEDLVLISATDELESIFELEHGMKLEGRFNNNLYLIDFTITEIIWKTDVNCLMC